MRLNILLTCALLLSVLLISIFKDRSLDECPLPSFKDMRPSSISVIQESPIEKTITTLAAVGIEPAELIALRDSLPQALKDHPGTRIYGRAILHTGDAPCASTVTGVPWITTQPYEPRAGEIFLANFYPLMLSAPSWPIVIFAAFHKTKVDLSHWGFTDCWLLVPPDMIFFPSSEPESVFYREEGGSVLRMRWLIPEQWASVKVYLQPVVACPIDVAPKGQLLGPALEIIVGSKR